jgi:hypothetical protein
MRDALGLRWSVLPVLRRSNEGGNRNCSLHMIYSILFVIFLDLGSAGLLKLALTLVVQQMLMI